MLISNHNLHEPMNPCIIALCKELVCTLCVLLQWRAVISNQTHWQIKMNSDAHSAPNTMVMGTSVMVSSFVRIISSGYIFHLWLSEISANKRSCHNTLELHLSCTNPLIYPLLCNKTLLSHRQKTAPGNGLVSNKWQAIIWNIMITQFFDL